MENGLFQTGVNFFLIWKVVFFVLKVSLGCELVFEMGVSFFSFENFIFP